MQVNWILKAEDSFINQAAISLLKERRTKLRNIIPGIKHTVKKQQAIKKEKRINYLIGRMIFFKEDYSTARKKLEEQIKCGSI